MTKKVPIDSVVVPDGRRPVRNLDQLAESIRQLGLLNPITITKQSRLVAGRNRLEACKLLQWKEIPANVVSLSDLDVELAEIDENLCRNELSTLERCVQMKRRKEIYEAIHPEAKPVSERGGPGRGKKTTEIISVVSFADDTAAKTNQSPRTIRHEVHIAEKITEKAKEAIRGTPLEDHKTELIHLARVPEEEQVEVVQAIIEGKAKTVSQAKQEVKRREKREALQAKADASPQTEATSWEIITGDCIETLENLEHGSARLIFADPPYNVGIDYGDGANADLLPPAKFVEWLFGWIVRARDVLTADGSLWALISDEYAAECCIEIKGAGFTIRNWIKWYEGFGVNCHSKFNRCTRHLFHATKHATKHVFHEEAVSRPSDRQTKYNDARANPGGKLLDDCWFDIPRLAGTHNERIPDFPTQLPLALLERVIACASDPGDLVIDPFNGSGTTGVAALRLGRRYLGIERQERFAALATLRLKGESA